MCFYIEVDQLVAIQHSFSLFLVGPCKSYAWVHAGAESVYQTLCLGVVLMYCYISLLTFLIWVRAILGKLTMKLWKVEGLQIGGLTNK